MRNVWPHHHKIPTCRPANVSEVQKLNDDILLVPLIPLDNPHFLATVIVVLLIHGIPFEELQRRYHLPQNLSRTTYTQQIATHGRCIYGELAPGTQKRPLRTTTIWNLPEPILPGESPALYERRTGCPQDLFNLAILAIPAIPNHQPNTPLSTLPTHPSNRRRIVTTKQPLQQ